MEQFLKWPQGVTDQLQLERQLDSNKYIKILFQFK